MKNELASDHLETNSPEPSNAEPIGRSLRLKKFGAGVMFMLMPVGVIYGFGVLRGNPISESRDVDASLQQILEPTAINIARAVLRENMQLNNNIVVTRPDSGGEPPSEVVSISSITSDNHWITVDASIYRNSHGQLDPTTVNKVNIYEYDCDPPGVPNGECGGSRSKERIDILYGTPETFTQGDWGLEDDLTLDNENEPAITINTGVKNPTEVADKPDAQHAIKEAKVFSRVAKMWTRQALDGKVDVPQLKKQKTNRTNLR